MTAGSERLESLDVFRGLSIAAMILVSTPGTWNAVYTQLDHALWNGWTITDLVFPFLLFAMGAAVPFALARRRGTRPIGSHVVRRAMVLFALGLVLNAIEAAPPLQLATFRIPGVLQRIAIVFAVVAWLTERGSLRVQIATVIAALAAYWAALTLIPVPGAGAGVLTPEGNLASWLDRAVLGRHLLNRWSDPEGILSTLPAIATAMGGVFAGDWLKERPAFARGFGATGREPHHSAWLFAAGFAGDGRRTGLGPRVSDQQEPVDQFVRAVQRRTGGANARALPLAGRRARLAQLVASARRLRTQSARRLLPVGRTRRDADARHRARQRIAQGDHLPQRVRAVAAAVLRL